MLFIQQLFESIDFQVKGPAALVYGTDKGKNLSQINWGGPKVLSQQLI